MKPVFNQHVYPQGGYHFTDPAGVNHVGTSFADLVERVRDFRVQQGLPIGDPAQEVNDFICAQDPQACHMDRPAAPPPQAGVSLFGSRIVRWILKATEMVGISHAEPVRRDVAMARAMICLKCPRQLSWKSGCGGCDSNARRMSIALRRGKETLPLLGCELLAEDTRSSVWLKLAPSKNPELPPECWRKST